MAGKENINNDMDAKRSSPLNKGAWTADEDMKLAKCVEIHGPRRWKSVAIKSGLQRCEKSCRLRWLNYLRPDIKRGNFSDAEEDLILRLHRLLGNRWSLIARRLPGRTDNEIKNYWNAHLRKKAKLMEKLPATPPTGTGAVDDIHVMIRPMDNIISNSNSSSSNGIHDDADDDDDPTFDFSTQGTNNGLPW